VDILAVMADFQAAQLAAIAGGGLDDAHLAALVNNNARAHAESADLADRLGGAVAAAPSPSSASGTPAWLPPGFSVEPETRPPLDVEAACRGFLDVAAAATRALAARTLAGDAALGGLFAKAACSADWRAGRVTPAVAATLVDYHGDYAALVEPAFAKRLAEALARGAAAHYAAATLALIPTKAGGAGPDVSPGGAGTQAPPPPPSATTTASTISTTALMTGGWWTPADAERLRADAADLAAAMAPHCRSPEAATRAVRPLADVADLAGADGVDAAVLAYTAALASTPSLAPAMVDRLLAARADWTRAEAKAAAAAVRDAHAARVGVGGRGGTPALSPIRGGGGGSVPPTATPGGGPPRPSPGPPAVASAVRDSAFRAALAALMEGGGGGG